MPPHPVVQPDHSEAPRGHLHSSRKSPPHLTNRQLMIASPPQSRWASVRAAHGGGDRDVAAVARRLQSLGDAAHAAMRHVQACLPTHLLAYSPAYSLACCLLACLLPTKVATHSLFLCAAGATAALPGVH